MGNPENRVGASYVRTKKVRMGDPETWERIIKNYRNYNTHLPLSLLASQLSDEVLAQIHERIVAQENNGK